MATAVAALIAAATTACTQGVAADVPDAGAAAGGHEARARVIDAGADERCADHVAADDVRRRSRRPPRRMATSVTRRHGRHGAAHLRSSEFASALAPVEVSVLGAPVSVPARDSVARLWLLVGRPPTADELRTAVTAAVRDGVPLDALATLLLHSPDGPVALPDAPPD